MVVNVKTAPISQLTAYWIEWGTEHQDAVRALLSGDAIVVKVKTIKKAALVASELNSRLASEKIDVTK